jgi:hypothetical protein
VPAERWQKGAGFSAPFFVDYDIRDGKFREIWDRCSMGRIDGRYNDHRVASPGLKASAAISAGFNHRIRLWVV